VYQHCTVYTTCFSTRKLHALHGLLRANMMHWKSRRHKNKLIKIRGPEQS
jgi:hypothetical protein